MFDVNAEIYFQTEQKGSGWWFHKDEIGKMNSSAAVWDWSQRNIDLHVEGKGVE